MIMCMVIFLDVNIVIIVMFATRQSDSVQRASIVENVETENESHYIQKASKHAFLLFYTRYMLGVNAISKSYTPDYPCRRLNQKLGQTL